MIKKEENNDISSLFIFNLSNILSLVVSVWRNIPTTIFRPNFTLSQIAFLSFDLSFFNSYVSEIELVTIYTIAIIYTSFDLSDFNPFNYRTFCIFPSINFIFQQFFTVHINFKKSLMSSLKSVLESLISAINFFHYVSNLNLYLDS